METNTSTAAVAATPSISISDLNLVQGSNTPFEMDVISPKTDKPTGAKILVLGDHADKVKKYVFRELNMRRQAQAARLRKGNQEVESFEDDEQFAIESCVARTAGWNFTEPFTVDAARQLYTQNPALRTQVLVASGNAGNFTKL